MVANAFVVGSISTNVKMGVGVVGSLGTIVFGLIGHVVIVGLATIVIGATIASDFFLQSHHYALDVKDLKFCTLQVMQMFFCLLLIEI